MRQNSAGHVNYVNNSQASVQAFTQQIQLQQQQLQDRDRELERERQKSRDKDKRFMTRNTSNTRNQHYSDDEDMLLPEGAPRDAFFELPPL